MRGRNLNTAGPIAFLVAGMLIGLAILTVFLAYQAGLAIQSPWFR